jgi:hypothetical protein
MALIIKNVCCALILVAVEMLFEVVDVKYFKVNLLFSRVLFWILVTASFCGFFVINKQLFSTVNNKILKLIYSIGVGGVITLIAWSVVIIIGVNFRIRIGGGL